MAKYAMPAPPAMYTRCVRVRTWRKSRITVARPPICTSNCSTLEPRTTAIANDRLNDSSRANCGLYASVRIMAVTVIGRKTACQGAWLRTIPSMSVPKHQDADAANHGQTLAQAGLKAADVKHDQSRQQAENQEQARCRGASDLDVPRLS